MVLLHKLVKENENLLFLFGFILDAYKLFLKIISYFYANIGFDDIFHFIKKKMNNSI